jgi:NTE family protein
MDDVPQRRDGEGLKVLVLQGGGALGAYQAGAYEALAENGYEPDWVAGISIGAINGAIIAGNRPENRVPRLRAFWERVSSGLQGLPFSSLSPFRFAFNEASSFLGLIGGAPGFFEPRIPPPAFAAAQEIGELSYYSTGPLRQTLGELIEFPVGKGHAPRLSVGAVGIEDGNFAYFDSQTEPLRAEHIMASGALPPGLPPIKIGERHFWDGGIVSNTPLQYVLDAPTPAPSLCIFQVDLFSAAGSLPDTLSDAVEREKEIRFSSRTRLNTAMMREKMETRKALKRLIAKLPAELRDDPDARLLAAQKEEPDVEIMHIIYRARAYEGHARDYEFSRVSMEEHWAAGRKDVANSLKKEAWTKRGRAPSGVRTYDLAHGEKVK